MEETDPFCLPVSNGSGQLYGGHSHGCLGKLWLGRAQLKGLLCTGNMVSPRSGLAHKCERTGGCSQVSEKTNVDRGLCESCCGQQDYSCLHKQAGRHQVKNSLQPVHKIVELCSGHGGLDKSPLGAQRAERGGGHAVQVQHHGLGVCTGYGGGSEAVADVVHSSAGPLCQCRLPSSVSLLQLPARQECYDQGLLQSVPVASQVLCFPSSSNDQFDIGQTGEGQGVISYPGGAQMASLIVVDEATANASREPSPTPRVQNHPDISSGIKDPISQPSSGLPGFGQASLLSQESRSLLESDIRKGTHKIYKSRFGHFKLYCGDVGVDPYACPEEVIVNFLTILSRVHGYTYQTVCGYRSAISRYHVGFGTVLAGSARIIKRVTKAVFNENPPLPRYSAIWNVQTLVSHLETLHPPELMTVSDLGTKTLALIAISSLSRSSSLSLLAPTYDLQEDTIIFTFTGLEKTSRPGHVRGEMRVPVWLNSSNKDSLNIHLYLQHYLEVTESRRAYFEAAEGHRPHGLFISNLKVCIL